MLKELPNKPHNPVSYFSVITQSKQATFENQPITDKATNLYSFQRVNCFYEDMKDVQNFMDYFNETMAKPFKWTYEGKALTA